MGRPECDGFVEGLRGQSVQFTGKTLVDGGHWSRDRLRREARRLGANLVADSSRNRRMTLLVLGEFTGNVVDPANNMSKQVRYVAQERTEGNHICVIDGEGVCDLFSGRPAPCMELHEAAGNGIQLSKPDRVRVFGGAVALRSGPIHDAVELVLDLSALDRGTAAHERILDALRQHLAPVEAQAPGPGAPLFDLGWVSLNSSTVHIAEVKSLPGTGQDQQIRLGIGQVLDYAHTVRGMSDTAGCEVVPVLVLEREPIDSRWLGLAGEVGILLTWAPAFPSIKA